MPIGSRSRQTDPSWANFSGPRWRGDLTFGRRSTMPPMSSEQTGVWFLQSGESYQIFSNRTSRDAVITRRSRLDTRVHTVYERK